MSWDDSIAVEMVGGCFLLPPRAADGASPSTDADMGCVGLEPEQDVLPGDLSGGDLSTGVAGDLSLGSALPPCLLLWLLLLLEVQEEEEEEELVGGILGEVETALSEEPELSPWCRANSGSGSDMGDEDPAARCNELSRACCGGSASAGAAESRFSGFSSQSGVPGLEPPESASLVRSPSLATAVVL